MIKLFILLIICFFALIMFFPFKIYINYNDKKLDVIISYLFLKFNITNLKTKKSKKELGKKNKKFNIKNFFIVPKIIKESFFVLTLIKIIFKKINFQKLYVVLLVSSDKSESCATNYFYIRTVIYNISKILNLKNKIKKFRIRIVPIFFDENIDFKLSLILKISPLMILLSIFELSYICLSRKNKC